MTSQKSVLDLENVVLTSRVKLTRSERLPKQPERCEVWWMPRTKRRSKISPDLKRWRRRLHFEALLSQRSAV
jgi:hypothetical protein